MKSILKNILVVFISAGFIAVIHSCTKEKVPTSAVLTTTPISGITRISAISGGNVTSDGGSNVTSRGICWNTTQSPTTAFSNTSDGTGIGAFTSNLTGLTANTTYYVRAYATNSVGTAYGNEISFSTSPVNLPAVNTNSISWITLFSAAVEGTISNDGGATIMEEGFCWDINTNPTTASNTKYGISSSSPTFLFNIPKLIPNTIYYVRAYAINSAGTVYGNELSFKTKSLDGISFNTDLAYGSVSDQEGNTYKTITIGTQIWMAENLKATKYSNGDLIGTTIPDTLNIYEESDPKYQWAYEGDENLVVVFGRLYTWYSATDSRNVCPIGWHVPSDAEWTTLKDFLGGESLAGGKLKESGFTHWTQWTDPNPASNETGFTALPGGYRHNGGVFYSINNEGFWWSSTQTQDGYGAWGRNLTYGNNTISIIGEYQKSAYSVRCLKDN